MDSLAAWFATNLGKYISAKAVVFIVSLIAVAVFYKLTSFVNQKK